MKKFAPRQTVKWLQLALLAILLIGYWVSAAEPAAIAENTAPTSETEQQPAPPAEPAAASDETLVGTANSLRDYFASQTYKPDTIVANRQLAENTIVVFRASDLQERMVLLVLSGVAAAARGDEKKGQRPPPLTLELSYIEDAAHPDVFKIGKGQF